MPRFLKDLEWLSGSFLLEQRLLALLNTALWSVLSMCHRNFKNPVTTFVVPLAYVRAVFIAVVCVYMVKSLICCILLLRQEFNIEKLQIVEAEKRKIRQEYERKENQLDIKKKMYGQSISNKAFCPTSIFFNVCCDNKINRWHFTTETTQCS